MKIEDFEKKSEKIKRGSSRTIQLTANPKKIGIEGKDLDSALVPILSRLASSENSSNSAMARTDGFQDELMELTGKVNSQNIKLAKFEQLVHTLLSDNTILKKTVEKLTLLVEHGPLFSPGIMNNEDGEITGLVPNMKNLGTSKIPLFSMEINTNGN